MRHENKLYDDTIADARRVGFIDGFVIGACLVAVIALVGLAVAGAVPLGDLIR